MAREGVLTTGKMTRSFVGFGAVNVHGLLRNSGDLLSRVWVRRATEYDRAWNRELAQLTAGASMRA